MGVENRAEQNQQEPEEPTNRSLKRAKRATGGGIITVGVGLAVHDAGRRYGNETVAWAGVLVSAVGMSVSSIGLSRQVTLINRETRAAAAQADASVTEAFGNARRAIGNLKQTVEEGTTRSGKMIDEATGLIKQIDGALPPRPTNEEQT